MIIRYTLNLFSNDLSAFMVRNRMIATIMNPKQLWKEKAK